MLPSDLDSPNNLPPGGAANIFVGSVDNGSNGIDQNVYYYHFHFVPSNPSESTFDCINGACKIAVNQYQNASGTATEPGGSVIDTLSDRLMYRFAYRILPGLPSPRQHGALQHHAAVAGQPCCEQQRPLCRSLVRVPRSVWQPTPTVFQQGTYDPDTTNRFMSSLAADKKGNIAMSYTVSSSANNVFPTIAYTGRSISDPAGTMGAEQIVIPGVGSQTDTSNRWGDYYNMAIGTDACTFVTTGEYYQSTGSFHWSTRDATLKFANCN